MAALGNKRTNVERLVARLGIDRRSVGALAPAPTAMTASPIRAGPVPVRAWST
jgi:hypothetical protein